MVQEYKLDNKITLQDVVNGLENSTITINHNVPEKSMEYRVMNKDYIINYFKEEIADNIEQGFDLETIKGFPHKFRCLNSREHPVTGERGVMVLTSLTTMEFMKYNVITPLGSPMGSRLSHFDYKDKEYRILEYEINVTSGGIIFLGDESFNLFLKKDVSILDRKYYQLGYNDSYKGSSDWVNEFSKFGYLYLPINFTPSIFKIENTYKFIEYFEDEVDLTDYLKPFGKELKFDLCNIEADHSLVIEDSDKILSIIEEHGNNMDSIDLSKNTLKVPNGRYIVKYNCFRDGDIGKEDDLDIEHRMTIEKI